MSGEDSSSHTRQEIGRTLERARKERGLSLEEVEQATKIRVRYLRALENENFDVLPAVYMLGSLKTYARHLGLDEAALTREFKHRQALLQDEQNPSQEEPQPSESRGVLASLGRLLGVGSFETGEDDSGTVPGSGHSPRLYLSLGVVLIFVLATALASSLRPDVQPTVSQVNQPKASQFPTMLVLVGNLKDDRRSENNENQPEKLAKSTAKDASKDEKDKAERSGQDKDAPQTAQVTSATAFASASASASPASTGSASATATPASDSPKPAATGETDDGETDEAHEGMAVAAPAPPSARAPGGPAVQQKKASPVGAIRLGDRISSKVRVAVHSPR